MALIYALNNLIESLAASQITMTNEDANYPNANLYDRAPCKEARFASAGADRAVTIDNDALQTQGSFEDASLAGWVDADTGTGSSTSSTANPHAGGSTRHLRLAPGVAGVAERYRDIVVRPGDRLRVYSLWIDSDGTNFCELRIRNLNTGNYLNGSAAWQAAATFALRGNSASYADAAAGGFNATFESFLQCQRETIAIRISLRATANTTIDVDDFALGITPNLLTIHGHNVPMQILTEWRHSDDNSVYSTFQTATPYQPSFAHSSVVAGTYSEKRYQQFRIPGTPADGSISLLGELGLWRGFVAARSVNLEPSLEFVPRVVRNEVGGHIRVYRQSGQAARIYRFTKRVVSASEYQTIRDDLQRVYGGAHPILWIPDSAAPAPMPVLYGIVPSTTRWVQPLPTTLAAWDLEEFEIHEQPFPNVVL